MRIGIIGGFYRRNRRGALTREERDLLPTTAEKVAERLGLFVLHGFRLQLPHNTLKPRESRPSDITMHKFRLSPVVWAEEGSAATYFVVSSLRFRRISIKAVFGAKVRWSR